MKILVAIGSYEHILYGLDVSLDVENMIIASTKVSFAIPAHAGMIKSIASCPKYLATGGTDDSIKIFDLKHRKEIGTITSHSELDAIFGLDFYKSSYLFSCSLDGTIGIFRTSDWESLHVMRHGKHGVLSVAVHPSGKLAASIGPHRSMRVWNLKTGKRAGKEKVHIKAEKILWSRSGSYYALLAENTLSIYETADARLIHTVDSKRKLAAAKFFGNEYLLYAGEGSSLCILDFHSKNISTRLFDLEQKPRIKDLSLIESESTAILATASSDGTICLWNLKDILNSNSAKPLLTHNCELRITCMTLTEQ